MQYFITFLEGILTFLSPCVLPMLPVYVLYFMGDGKSEKKSRAFLNALGFVAGFTAVFLILGVFAGTVGSLLLTYQTVVNLVMGAVVVCFGLHYLGVFQLGFLNKTMRADASVKPNNTLSAAVFGAVFAVGWSPCTGTFLGSALMLAAGQTGWLKGMELLLCYSLGLGIPFLLCAVLLDQLKGTLNFIKRNYKTVNRICGGLLIVVGIAMMTGIFYRLTASLAA